MARRYRSPAATISCRLACARAICAVAVLFVAALAGLHPVAAQGQTVAKAYPLPGHGALEVEVPGDWIDRVGRRRGSLLPTIRFGPSGQGKFMVLITPGWNLRNDPTFNELPTLRAIVADTAKRVQAQAVEPELRLQEIIGSAGRGFYFQATDRAPKPGEYKFMTQGAMSVGDLMVVFTILTDHKNGPIVIQALDMLRGAGHRRN